MNVCQVCHNELGAIMTMASQKCSLSMVSECNYKYFNLYTSEQEKEIYASADGVVYCCRNTYRHILY